MKKVLKIILLFVCVCGGCNNEISRTQSSDSHSFAIYLIEESFWIPANEPGSFKYADIEPQTVTIKGEPVISDEDIIEYDWKTQTVKISPQAVERIPEHPPTDGIPFIVVADGQRCYIGAFWTMISSVASTRPIIEVYDAKDGTFTIQRMYPDRKGIYESDPRNDERVNQALEALGKLKTAEREKQ